MKQTYIKPTVEVIQFSQEGTILTGSNTSTMNLILIDFLNDQLENGGEL